MLVDHGNRADLQNLEFIRLFYISLPQLELNIAKGLGLDFPLDFLEILFEFGLPLLLIGLFVAEFILFIT